MYVRNPTSASNSLFGGNTAKKIDVVGDFDVEAKLTAYAKQLDTFSSREISKAWHCMASSSIWLYEG